MPTKANVTRSICERLRSQGTVLFGPDHPVALSLWEAATLIETQAALLEEVEGVLAKAYGRWMLSCDPNNDFPDWPDDAVGVMNDLWKDDWPKDAKATLAKLDGMVKDVGLEDEPYTFDEMIDPIIKALRFAYKFRRQNNGKSIPWDGPRLGKNMRANSLEFEHRLSAENLTYSKDDQGRDALDEILGVALQVGIEQGRRITMQSSEVETMRQRLQTARVILGAAETPNEDRDHG